MEVQPKAQAKKIPTLICRAKCRAERWVKSRAVKPASRVAGRRYISLQIFASHFIYEMTVLLCAVSFLESRPDLARSLGKLLI